MKNYIKLIGTLLFITIVSSRSASAQIPEVNQYFSVQEVSKANTAASINYLTDNEKDFILWLNLTRLYPQKMIQIYTDYVKNEYATSYYNSTYFKSLIKNLEKMQALKALLPDEDEYLTANCWALEAGKNGYIGHNRKGCKENSDAECCSYGDSKSGFFHLEMLLTDNGIPNLGHRKILLSPNYKWIGVSIQPHSKFGYNLVVNMR